MRNENNQESNVDSYFKCLAINEKRDLEEGLEGLEGMKSWNK